MLMNNENTMNSQQQTSPLSNGHRHHYQPMLNHKIRPCSVLLIIVLGLQGCASTSDGSRTKMEGTAAGAVIGGVLGLALGDSKKSTIIGTAVGAVIGNMYGKHVADKKAEYKDTESYMQAMIAESEQVIVASRSQRDSLQASINSQKEFITALKSAHSKQQITKQELSQQLAKNEHDIKVTAELLTAIDKEIEIQQQVLHKERAQLAMVLVNQSEANITSMESEKRQLQLLKAQLAGLDYRRVY
ncbi:MAG: glycine zipper 2TM domain-containing protein [Gammaproteobacteria bacterium]|nr:glycine zipper 2TM domain-containing protein [Gammaproteobacteria bacterium]